MRIINTFAAVAALSISFISSVSAEEVTRLSDLQTAAPVVRTEVRTVGAPAAVRVCAYRQIPDGYVPTDGCTGSELRMYLISIGVLVSPARAPVTPVMATAPVSCTVSIARNGDHTFTNCSESQIRSMMQAASPYNDAANATNKVEDRRFVRDMIGTIVVAGTNRVFYGNNGYYGRGGYSSYDRGGYSSSYSSGRGGCYTARGEYIPC